MKVCQRYLTIALMFAMIINLGFSLLIEIEKTNHGFGIDCFANTSLGGCAAVQNSSYGTMFGISNSLIGIIAFLLLAILYFVLIAKPQFIKQHEGKDGKYGTYLLATIALMMLIGSIISLWFFFVMFFILYQVCTYCVIVDCIMLASTITFFVLYRKEIPSAIKKIAR